MVESACLIPGLTHNLTLDGRHRAVLQNCIPRARTVLLETSGQAVLGPETSVGKGEVCPAALSARSELFSPRNCLFEHSRSNT